MYENFTLDELTTTSLMIEHVNAIGKCEFIDEIDFGIPIFLNENFKHLFHD